MNGELEASYRLCAGISNRHGRTYSLAARLLPAEGRRHVHAVYALCRMADDIVDEQHHAEPGQRLAELEALHDRLLADLAAGHSEHPVLAAVVATVASTGIPVSCFDRFFSSMAMDISVTQYASWAELCRYMDGSAAVIGEMMLPVLGGGQDATPAARALGMAFQLTNFLRDVGEDLDRGRVYLPQDELAAFGADPRWRTVTPAWRQVMAFQIERNLELYRQADAGIELLPARSASCVRAARVVYSRILDEIEAADYDVFSRRATVPDARKWALALGSLRHVRPFAQPVRV
ncbi:MAG TPA: phytoene/squalene synthase family protein [Actinomycetales bacterium]|nr:phytoene/squalene synthase family protein [Actinomycetales bacterium]